jgi:hypothetical protein
LKALERVLHAALRLQRRAVTQQCVDSRGRCGGHGRRCNRSGTAGEAALSFTHGLVLVRRIDARI